MFSVTVEAMLEQGLRNGMSFKQLRERVPGLAAKRLGITVADFHAELTKLGDPAMCAMADRVAARFTPAEQAEIATRKF